jgi:glycosyltransferase involved in cell wall biosynthesis
VRRDFLSDVAGLCVVRDSADIVPLLCGHYLRLGFGHIEFVDDGSTDGTFELLKEISEKTGRVSVRQVTNENFEQAALVTDAANRLIDGGYRLIFPFDADEFWYMSQKDVQRLAARHEPRCIIARLTNFIQSRRVTHPGPLSLFPVRYRVSDEMTATIDEVVGYQKPWVVFPDRPKIGFWARNHVAIVLGQHDLESESTRRDEQSFEIFHLPFRNRSELTKRALNYEPRRARERIGTSSWQSKFHRDVVLADRSDEVWAANSADSCGRLDAYGKPVQLVRDNRLRNALIRAASYMFRRYRVTAL